MAEYTLTCRVSGDETLTGIVDADGDVRLEMRSDISNHIYVRPDDFAEFARNLLADAGADAESGLVKVGDLVEIVKYRSYSSEYEGLTGRVTAIDEDDLPYLVDTNDAGEVWAVEVRKVSEPAPACPGREALVSKAKSLLADTPHTAADLLRLAEFLAGE
ncbi:hypothetical protein [Streptomyces sp. bgisy159]|uniref:hypothetical protein n=1 Tax=Streptomyces sp. bgisy159 TaxID=3413795 RepID=UPI003F4A1A8F